jgi:RAD51-like protein 3
LTQSLLLQLALHHLVHHPQSSVLWIDTTGDFSAVRAAEILGLFDVPVFIYAESFALR